jgi:hypothetical protein
MTAPTLWLEITFAGFVYLIGIGFLVLAGYRIGDLRLLQPPAHYLPYLSAGIVAASYVIGIVTHRLISAARKAIDRLVKPAATVNRDTLWWADAIRIWQFGSQRVHREIDFHYGLFALLRSLTFSIPFTGLSVVVWMVRTGEPGRGGILFLTAAFWGPCYLAFRQQRSYFRLLRAAAEKDARRWAAAKGKGRPGNL